MWIIQGGQLIMISGRFSFMEKTEESVKDGFGDVVSTEWSHSLLVRN